MPSRPYRLLLPVRPAAPVVVASPHSGRTYDSAFLARTILDSDGIRSSEDAYVDLLLENVPALGLPLLAAEMPRAYIDLNRSSVELDPAVVCDVPRGAANPRVTSGLGVIPRVVGQGRAIYEGKITRAEAQERIEMVWQPYHSALDGLLTQAQERFGRAILLDCHSMPHEAIEGGALRSRPEIVLGDRFGSSADPALVDGVEAIFAGLGLRVARNAPFAGAYTTQRYGKPDLGRHAIQIEIDRSLYLDEAKVAPNANFEAMRELMTEAMARIRDLSALPERLAAE
ncbi:MAG: N-formylglutamate amidohydrolase [Jannaschia sp.]